MGDHTRTNLNNKTTYYKQIKYACLHFNGKFILKFAKIFKRFDF